MQFQANDEDGWKQRLLNDTVAPDQVTGIQFDGRILKWAPTHDNRIGNGVKQYIVEIALDSSFENVVQTKVVEKTEYAVSDLAIGNYYYRVRAEDYTENVGAWSETVSGDLDNVPPSQVTGGQHQVNGYDVTLSWNAVTDMGSGVKEYEYRIASDSSFETAVRSGTTENLSVGEKALVWGTYYWQVRAVDQVGNAGEWSLSKNFMTIDSIAPSMPANADYAIDGNSVTVTWDASADDELGSGLAGYTVQIAGDTSFTNIVKSVNITATEAEFTGLDGGDYYLRIGAADNAGNQSIWTETQEFTLADLIPPEAPTASADITTPTNQNVTVTATFSEDSVQKQYSLDGENFLAYNNGVVMEDNGTVYFRGIDEAGNVSEVTSYTVNNIDKVAPTAPTASADVTAPTNQNVTVTATFSDDSAQKQYSLDGKNFLAYDNGLVMQDNGTVYFRGIDAAGNASEVTSYEASNIDKIAPEAPTISADITALTNQNVTISATFRDDSAQKQYSLDGENFLAYDNGVVMQENGTAYFRGIDEAGNISDVTSYTVTNIDKVAPEKPTATADITSATNQNVTVTAIFSEDSVQKQYSLDNTNWSAYTSGIVMSDNGSV